MASKKGSDISLADQKEVELQDNQPAIQENDSCPPGFDVRQHKHHHYHFSYDDTKDGKGKDWLQWLLHKFKPKKSKKHKPV